MPLPLLGYVREGRSLAVGYLLQKKHIALEIAKKIWAVRQNLLSKLGKSQGKATVP